VLRYFKKVKVQKLFLSAEDYFTNFHTKGIIDLDKEQFKEVFSPALNNCNRIFNKLKNTEDRVNFSEAFVSMTIFSEGMFDTKLQGLYRSFDIDNGGTIDRSELMTLL
jgi:Ca2+-binding EF-hand superfamily protein